MDNNFNNFNDFLNYCMKCYESTNSSKNSKNESNSNTSSNTSNNNSNENNSNTTNNSSSDCGGDIPGGFQTINPQFFLIIGELMGNVMAGNMPFNVQNVIGNWLQLIGQAIEVFNAQQQYMQGGPGRYYDIRNLNINNPFCSGNSNTVQQEADGPSLNNNGSSNANNVNRSNEISELKEYIEKLNKEVENLKKEIKNIKKDK